MRLSSNFSGQYELHILLSGFIRGSTNPISAAIQVARFLEEHRPMFPQIEKGLIEIISEVQQMAIEQLGDIHSNRLAVIALEANGTLDTAIEARLMEFVSSERVQFLKQLMWTSSGEELMTKTRAETFRDTASEIETWYQTIFGNFFMVFVLFFSQMFQRSTWKYLKEFFCTTKHQMPWFFSPIGKIQIEFFLYFVYFMLLVVVAIGSKNVYGDLTFEEFVFWICNASFFWAEARQFLTESKSEYFADATNSFDIIINVTYLLLGLVRFAGYFDSHLEALHSLKCSDHPEECLENGLNIFYVILWFILIVAVCIRIAWMSVIFYNLGMMIRAMYTMVGDVGNFLVLILLFLFGFSLALHVGTNGEAHSYNNIWTSCRALFYAMLGDLDYGEVINDTECITDPENEGLLWPDNECVNNIN